MTILPLHTNGHVIARQNEATVLRVDGLQPLVSGVAHRCAVCDRRPEFEITEDAVQVQDPCPYPDGITTEITLSVPSGKIIVTDNLRPIYRVDVDAFACYNSTLGQAQVVEAMAAIGCAYGPVGNTCPGLYRTGPDSYVIAKPRHDDHDNPSLPEEACLATICTNLWAYSIADFEHWKARGGDPDKLGWSETIVDVPPGTYRFIHHSGERGFDRDGPDTVIFAHIELIAKGRRVRRLIASAWAHTRRLLRPQRDRCPSPPGPSSGRFTSIGG
ncbi:hypothetical protein OG800_49460 (plasmid) [Streptomyces sp. NBC_00445]|uniref:hypothetical protein n=1 Tax=Streptomyces sp. NBC_00445 TaxID=2975745 RepID=UPI002E250EEA